IKSAVGRSTFPNSARRGRPLYVSAGAERARPRFPTFKAAPHSHLAVGGNGILGLFDKSGLSDASSSSSMPPRAPPKRVRLDDWTTSGSARLPLMEGT